MRIHFIVTLAFACTILSAQRNTYLGGGIGLISARFQVEKSLWLIQSESFIDGGSYDAYLRQEITRFLSVEVGYSWRNYDFEYKLSEDQSIYNHEGFWAHQIPINIDLEVDVLKDRISAYATFGYLVCVKQATGQNNYTQISQNGDSLMIEWNYIAESDHASQFSIGFGSRFRLFDEFLLDLEIGNVFSLKDLRDYKFTFKDQLGNTQSQTNTFRGDYWYLKIRFSYPIQRAVELIGKGISQIGR